MNLADPTVPFAARFDDRARRRGRLFAYASAWFGCYSEVMIDASAIVILYLTLLGGSATLTMLSTALTAIAAIALTLPSAGISNRIGLRKSYSIACAAGCGGFLLMAAAPWFGAAHDQYVVLLGCLVYCLSRPLYGVTWYPLLDNILLPAERGGFFGVLRFSYLGMTAVSFFLISLALGRQPPTWALQTTIALVGLLILGRKYCLDQLPINARERSRLDLRKAVASSIRNRPLTGFALYTCCLSLASAPLLPLTFIYLKCELQADAKIVQWISVAYMAGMIAGYWLSATALRRFGVHRLQPWGHLAYIACGLGVFLADPALPGFYVLVSALLFLLGFWAALLLCCYSMELLALARPGNKTMAAAFLNTCAAIGGACGRFGASLVLGAGLLAPHWNLGSLSFCSYQTLFLGFSALLVFFLLLLFLVPSIVPKSNDYYMRY